MGGATSNFEFINCPALGFVLLGLLMLYLVVKFYWLFRRWIADLKTFTPDPMDYDDPHQNSDNFGEGL